MLVKSGYIAVEVPRLQQAIHTISLEDEDALTKKNSFRTEVYEEDS